MFCCLAVFTMEGFAWKVAIDGKPERVECLDAQTNQGSRGEAGGV